MDKWRAIYLIFVFHCGLLVSFEKLPQEYQICYGNPHAPIHVVEYFSFSCSKCVKFLKEDFSSIRQNYIDTQKVYWVFHPDPADLLTLQFMVGLEKLSSPQKRLLFETLFTHLKDKTFHLGCFIIQTAMESLKQPLPQLDKMEFIETTDAFKRALAFLKQKGVITTIPTVEINGKIHDEYPTRQFLVKQFEAQGAKS